MRRVVIALCRIACALDALLLALLVIVDRRIAYFQSDLYVPLLSNATLLAMACVMFLVTATVAGRLKRSSKARHFSSSVGAASVLDYRYVMGCAIASLALFAFQAFAYSSLQLNTGWDVHEVTDAALTPVAEWPEWWFTYFSRYPNNLFLLWLLRSVDAIRSVVMPGMSSHLTFALCACAFSAFSFFLFTRVAGRVMRTTGWAAATSSVYLLLVGLSPWYMIPYSDTFGLLFCTILLWCFTCGRTPFTRWLLPSLVVVIGLRLKPTIVFAYVAFVVATLMTTAWDGLKWRGALVTCLSVVCGIGLGIVGTRSALSTLDVDLDSDAQFGMAHYLMMGLNDETDGSYLSGDGDFSASQPDVKTRDRADLVVAQTRLAAYGSIGLARHIVRKLFCIMNDGTFSWGAEGRFYLDMTVGEGPAAWDLSQAYVTDGSLYPLFRTMQQFWWVMVLAGIPLLLVGLGALHDDRKNAELCVRFCWRVL